ncbi:MAG: 2-hydroxyacid dehydrogenase [Clostridia bacterium]
MSAKPKVFVTRKLPEGGTEKLEAFADVEVWPDRLPPSSKQLLSSVRNANGLLCLLTDQIDEAILDAAPDLRVIANYAVGYDNIDVRAATSRGIWVTNTPGVLTETTADFAFALILAAARRLIEADRATRTGDWLTWEPTYMLGKDVNNATLGIVGMGRIGTAVARRARGFSMRILYTDTRRRERLESELGIEYADLERLLASSDFVTLHAPLTAETKGMIGASEFRRMKSEAVLINTARGDLVDEEALVWALEQGEVAAAGLDVYAMEPLSTDHPLTFLDNVVLAPHLGSATVEARTAMAKMASRNVIAVLSGKEPETPVNSPE